MDGAKLRGIFHISLSNFKLTTVLAISFVLLIIGEILWKLTDYFVQKMALRKYEK